MGRDRARMLAPGAIAFVLTLLVALVLQRDAVADSFAQATVVAIGVTIGYLLSRQLRRH